MSQQMAEETLGVIADGFRSETDPYGERWAPKLKKDGRKVLSGKTSRLKKWHVVKTDKGGFTVAPTVNYATFHQFGTIYMPRRPMVPDYRGIPRELGRRWEEVVEETLDKHFADGVKGGGVSWLKYKLIGLNRRFTPKALLKKAVKAVAG